MTKLNVLACGLVLAAAGPAPGQEARPTELRKVSQIIGSSVLLQDSVNYGKVEDIVLNEDGCIEYVVVAREDRYALMPWAVARVDYGQRAVIFQVAPQVVQPLFFARDAWPDVADPQFGRRVGDAFGPRVLRREVGREPVRPVPDAPQPTETPKAKAQGRPGRAPDTSAPAEPPKARAREKAAEAPPPAEPPKARATAKEKRPDAPPPAEPPKARARDKSGSP